MSAVRKRKLRKKIYRYTAVFESDKEEGGFTATIPSLPGCISEGDTFEKALDNIQEAADLYLEVMQEYQEEIPRERAGVFVAPIQVKI